MSPHWTEAFDIDYEIGRETRVNIGIYDDLSKKEGSHKPLGSAMFEIGDVLGVRGSTKAKKLRKGGTLFARVTVAKTKTEGNFILKLRGHALVNTERAWGVSNPFFEISARIQMAGRSVWHPVFRSEVVQSDLNPTWPECAINLERLLGDTSDLDRPILFSVYHRSRNGRYKPMGSFETSIKVILSKDTSNPKSFSLTRKNKELGEIHVVKAVLEDGKALNPNSNSALFYSSGYSMKTSNQAAVTGTSHLRKPSPAPHRLSESLTNEQEFNPKSSLISNLTDDDSFTEISLGDLPPAITPPMIKPSFLDYITGSCELKLSIAIDFTGSNGDPSQPGTLHYVYPNGQLNDYEKAITAVGSIIAKYDTGKMHAVYGFGAKFEGIVRHCFQISDSLYLKGVDGVIDGYRSFFRKGFIMSGPTVFAECIDCVAGSARTEQDIAARSNSQSYQILLILTDGAVSDIQQTRRSLENARDAPMSVVIVGIGSADFSAMQFLDDFQEGITGGRDICTFVEFSRFKNNRSALSKATLSQIPKQLVDFFYGKGILPSYSAEGNTSFVAADPDDGDVDLNLRIDMSGQMSLENYKGAIYDDTRYETTSSLSKQGNSISVTPPASSLRHSSSENNQRSGAQSDASLPSSTATTHDLFYVQVPQGIYSGMQLQVENPVTRQILVVTVPEKLGPGDRFGIPRNLYHVQVPPRASPGMQLRVQNPITGQMLLVTIPDGAESGSWFGVHL